MKKCLPRINFKIANDKTAADCHFLMMTESITIPEGASATVHDMLAAQRKIQDFVSRVEERLKGMDDAMLHDFVVDQLQELAEHYNHELGVFRSRQIRH